MNKQGKQGIEWCQFTWNPVGGCLHECKWEMPDGSIAECYAKGIAEKFTSAYQDGFESHYWRPDKLADPFSVKTPARVFLDSMSDLMGSWVPDYQISQVIDVCRGAHWHTFQLLTKNAPRLLKFSFPSNVWVGASVPPTFYMGKRLSPSQQLRMLERTLKILKGVDVPVRWMSIEPLSFDIAPYMKDCGLQWIVIGAASNGRKYYQPKAEWVQNLLDTLDAQNIPVFFKGNLDWLPWRESFPGDSYKPAALPTQLEMFKVAPSTSRG